MLKSQAECEELQREVYNPVGWVTENVESDGYLDKHPMHSWSLNNPERDLVENSSITTVLCPLVVKNKI